MIIGQFGEVKHDQKLNSVRDREMPMRAIDFELATRGDSWGSDWHRLIDWNVAIDWLIENT